MDTTHKTINLTLTHLPEPTKQALDILSKQSWLKEQKWYLAGGTALTLQCDQRVSVDLDFFASRKNIDRDLDFIINTLSPAWITTNRQKDKVYPNVETNNRRF